MQNIFGEEYLETVERAVFGAGGAQSGDIVAIWPGLLEIYPGLSKKYGRCTLD